MTNEEIFDWVMTCEDEKLAQVREEVIKSAEHNYGEQGRKVAEKYYKNIDGEDDDSTDDEPCPECAEKAKKLVESMNFMKYLSEILLDERLKQLSVDLDIDMDISTLETDFLMEMDTSKSCVKVDSNDVLKLFFLTLLTGMKGEWENHVSHTC